MKTCVTCKVEKSLSEFSAAPRGVGTRNTCKRCASIAAGKSRRRRMDQGGYPPVAEKRCGKCREVKTAEHFSLARADRTGLQHWCKACTQVARREQTYGLTDEQCQEMVERQAGRCAACDLEAVLHIHHNHETGEVLDLLCQGCNIAEGLLRTAERAEMLAAYIRRVEGRGSTQAA